MSDAASTRTDAFAVTVDESMDLRDGDWDGARGEREIFDWATSDGVVDWAKAARGFIVADLNPPAGESITRGSFKLAIAYVEDGELVGIGNAIRNALARLSQTEDLSDAVRAEAKAKLDAMLARLNEQSTSDVIARGVPQDAAAEIVTLCDRLRWKVVKGEVDQDMVNPINQVIHAATMTDYANATGRLSGALDDLARGDVERSEDEQAEIREEFPRLINGTPSQMREWSESPYAGENRKEGEARESARDALRRVIALKEKPMGEWTEGDYDDAVKAIAFVKRMSEVEQGNPIVIEGREGPSERDASLRDWGHWVDSADADVPTLDAMVSKIRGVAALPPVKRQALGWTDKAMAGALALLMSMGPAHADASDRVYRTCTMDFAVDAETCVAMDRALAIADEIGPRTDAAQINALAEQLRADGFADQVDTDGRMIVTGYAARTGSQLYGDGKRTWYEYRSEDEVEKSLPSYANKTFTDDHPPVLVTSDNWRSYTRGHLAADAELLPPAEDGHRYVKVTICVGDVATIRKMRDGKVELSAGYTTIAVRDPGTDAHGVRYTYRQTDIKINHLALVDQGRAGPRARVQIDGQAVFEIRETDTMPSTNDQMDPQMIMDLLAAFKAWGYADSPEAAEAAMSTIATMLGADLAMVKEHLSGSEMMEMDGVTLMVSKDAAAKIRAREQRIHGDAAKITNDLAKALGELSTLTRTVDALQAAKTQADLRDLERDIAPLCPQLVTAWASGARPDSLTAMRAAAILDLDPAAKVDLDKAWGPDKDKPSQIYDGFVEACFDSTVRRAKGRSKPTHTNSDGAQPFRSTIDTSTIYGKPATN